MESNLKFLEVASIPWYENKQYAEIYLYEQCNMSILTRIRCDLFELNQIDLSTNSVCEIREQIRKDLVMLENYCVGVLDGEINPCENITTRWVENRLKFN